MADLVTSRRGWVRTDCDLRIWVPCPGKFPPGMTLEDWARQTAAARWERSGLSHGEPSVTALAQLLILIHEHGYATRACHQIWIYLRDLRQLPLPVYLGIWQQAGDRTERLRLLSGAADPDADRAPHVREFAGGIRALRYTRLDSGDLCGTLGYAFRSAEFETDVQAWTATDDLRALQRAMNDVDALVRRITVYAKPAR